MVIDAHTHVINQRGGNRKLKPEDLVASMKKAGIDYSLVFANRLKYGQPTTSSEEGTSNEQVLEFCQRFPQLKAVACIDTTEIDDGLKRAEGYFKKGLIHALKLYPGYQDFNPAGKKLFPIHELCQRFKKPVIFHTGVLLTGMPGLLKQSHPLNIDEVAVHFQKLTIVMAHTGNPWILDAAAVVAKNPNVYVDVSGYFTEWQSITKQEAEDFLVVRVSDK